MRFLKNFSVVLLILFFLSCLGTKKITEKKQTKTLTEKTLSVSDSTKITQTNRKIDDVVTVTVPVSDPKLDAKIDEILSKINTSKTSGTNNYTLSYDRLKRQIIAELSIGETTETNKSTNNSFVSTKKDEERVIETSKKIISVIPWWGWLILIFLIRKQIISIIAIFIPGVRNINTIYDLFNPPNKNKDD